VTTDYAWIERLEAAGDALPAVRREPLLVAGRECGSIESALAERLGAAGLPVARVPEGWSLVADADTALAMLARWLHDNGLAGRWRDEALAVVDAQGERVGAIERAAVRPLGIATQAVHLVGTTPSGAVWIQQRAFDKAVDPGRWDTLMGGLVSADEAIADTLRRETWEESGLRFEQLRGVAHFGRRTVRRPVPDGYMIEHIEMAEAVVPDGLEPANQDGEVARFDLVRTPTLVERLAEGVFTIEASLVLLDWLRRRGVLPR